MLAWLHVLLLGIIEGVTELLPVSSTGHLLIAQHWLPRQSDLFNIVIQCGAVLAILPLPAFRGRVTKMLRAAVDVDARADLGKVSLAFVITAVGGLALEKAGLRLPDDVTPVAVALVVGGVAFVVVERVVAGRAAVDTVSWAMAAAVGGAQLVAAVFPGTSRSGASILLLLLLGLSRAAAAEFSFLVGIPTILAVGGYKILKALKADGGAGEDWALIAFGTVVSGVVSFVVVKWLLGYVQRHSFVGFGIYRIVAGLALLALALLS